ncbi:hypothetical protein AB0N14_26675 [Streptomyces sp. NPDC051104]|uniref:hypothetical protein n=1 Tax=Streptomyces sp. NPDC051104 TaxID=3155044 RepID=UPI0034203E76
MHTMRIAVAGATGTIGALTVAALEGAGHDVVRISRSLGVDLSTGEALAPPWPAWRPSSPGARTTRAATQ